jgi:hypothetical protein
MIASIVVFEESWRATKAAHAERARPSLQGTTRPEFAAIQRGQGLHR